MTPAETILALAGGVGGVGTAASKVWDWWKGRDATRLAAKLAAEAAEAKARHENEAAARVSSAGERADIVALLQRQLDASERQAAAGDARAEKSSARAEAIAAALASTSAAMSANSRALDELRAALSAHAGEEVGTLREVHAMLRSLVGGEGDVSRTSLIPGVRGPTPPRGIVPARKAGT